MRSMNKAKQLCTESWKKQPIQTDMNDDEHEQGKTTVYWKLEETIIQSDMNDDEHEQGKTTVYWKLKETTYPDRHEMGKDDGCEECDTDPQWQTCTKISYLIVHA